MWTLRPLEYFDQRQVDGSVIVEEYLDRSVLQLDFRLLTLWTNPLKLIEAI